MDAKRFLFVSADAALITDLAWQVHGEGHDVNRLGVKPRDIRLDRL